MSSIRDLFEQIDSAQKIINGSKNFETFTENDQVVKENLPSGTYTSLCVVFNFINNYLYNHKYIFLINPFKK